MVSYTGLLSITDSCGKGTIIGACRLLSRAVLAVSAYCLQHLTIQREAARSSVKFAGPQKCDFVLCAEKDDPVD